MIVIICGDRYWTDEYTISHYIQTLPPHSTIVHGDCDGADRIADFLGKRQGHLVIPVSADWDKYGLKAGPIRNKRMLKEHKVDLVVAFHDDLSKSTGTADMLEQAKKGGIPTKVHESEWKRAEFE